MTTAHCLGFPRIGLNREYKVALESYWAGRINHSPRIPSVESLASLLRKACARISADRLWVNPDCGLKTRDWPETEAALKNLVAAAVQLRDEQLQS